MTKYFYPQRAKTSAERTAKLRAKRKAAGWTILHIHLPPDASKVLAEWVKATGDTKAYIVENAILCLGD